jgi:glucose-1-phosphate cytidylyltransferase
MVLNKKAFDIVDEDSVDISLENGVLEKMASKDQLAVYQHGGFWQCMDTYREMEMLNNMWNKGQAPWRLW